ncbi:peptidase S8/S53 domain-containing protein [Trichophaea hybrida]|nr:peptidase S8/S53 domain-containing protein [Trichophaea hybrida]
MLETFTMTGDKNDNCGHGTHIAGLIGGEIHDVARRCRIKPIKILEFPEEFRHHELLQALIKVYKYIIAHPGKRIINIALSAGVQSQLIDNTINLIVDLGTPVFVAAGNVAQNADQKSPCSALKAFVVGNCDEQDRMHLTSGFGKLLSAFAPSTNIRSAGRCDEETVIFTGTSQSCAYVSGVAATIMARESTERPAQLYLRLRELTLKGKLSGVRGTGTPNEIIYNGEG